MSYKVKQDIFLYGIFRVKQVGISEMYERLTLAESKLSKVLDLSVKKISSANGLSKKRAWWISWMKAMFHFLNSTFSAC